jgi:hypothetical protein
MNRLYRPVDVSFDGAGVVAQGEAGSGGVVVGEEAAGKGVQFGMLVGLDGADPVVEAISAQGGEHDCEVADVPGQGIQMRARLVNGGQSAGLGGVEVLWVGAGGCRSSG